MPASGDNMSATAARESDGGVTDKGRIGGGRVKDGVTVAVRSCSNWTHGDKEAAAAVIAYGGGEHDVREKRGRR